MLILSRNLGESILVGDDVKLTIVQVMRGVVRIGITAPRDVAVHREEVWLRIQAGVTPTARGSDPES